MEHFPDNRMSSLRRKRFFSDDFERNQSKNRERKSKFIPEVTLNDIVLPEESNLKVRFIVKTAQLKKDEIYTFVLWSSRNGKTYTGQAIAGELRRNLMVFDLSKVLDMFVGGTEKVISHYFEMAYKTNSIIFIDEADSLLKARESSNRSWENSQVNHL